MRDYFAIIKNVQTRCEQQIERIGVTADEHSRNGNYDVARDLLHRGLGITAALRIIREELAKQVDGQTAER